MRPPARPVAMRRHHHAEAALVLAIFVVGCRLGGPPTTPSPSADAFVPQGAWQLVAGSADGVDIPTVEGHPITVVIEGSQISGTAACNHYGGRLTVSGGRLAISDLGMTGMACADPAAMDSEAAYTAALSRVEAIGGEGDQLVLSGPGVELRFDSLPEPPIAELVDTEWVLESLVSGDVASSPMGERATLELRADGTFVGSTGCRTFSGEWLKQGDQIIAPSLDMDPTECPAELSDQDSHVVTVIGDGFVPTVERDRLRLTDRDGTGLIYRAEE